jgi:hypothetical protein
VRELAQRSYRVLKAGRQPDGLGQAGAEDISEDLRDLRAQIARLQRKIHDRRLNGLIPWIDALWRMVSDGRAARQG